MKTTAFSYRVLLITVVSTLLLASLACGLFARETPIAEPTQVSPTTAIPALSETVSSGEGDEVERDHA